MSVLQKMEKHFLLGNLSYECVNLGMVLADGTLSCLHCITSESNQFEQERYDIHTKY